MLSILIIRCVAASSDVGNILTFQISRIKDFEIIEILLTRP